MRGDRRHLDGVALMWAEATAARDALTEPAPLVAARPVIAEVLDRPRAVLTVALGETDADVLAFALAAPRPRAESHAEVRYVGVRPGQWGCGLGGDVLRLLCAELAAAGFREAELLVYVDNRRAVALYERLGWRAVGTPVPHARTGKPEQRYRLTLRPDT